MASVLWTIVGIGLLMSSPHRWISVRPPEGDDRPAWPARCPRQTRPVGSQ